MENATNQMAENKEVTSTPTPTDGEKVTMSQADLENLINKKYAKGAEKAKSELLAELGLESVDSLKNLVAKQKEVEQASKTELEKLQEELKTLRENESKLKADYEKAQKDALINNLAVKNGIREVDYFAFELAKAQKAENFELDSFINNLKTNKPYVFGNMPKATDSSPNNSNQAVPLEQRVQGLTLKQLQELQKSL